MKTLVISDTHLEPDRQAGTTMESRAELDNWLFDGLEKVLKTPHDRVLFNGDVFAKYTVSDKNKLRLFNLLRDEPDAALDNQRCNRRGVVFV